MALRFPRFSQGLAQDPTTRRIWFGIATAHDFESHDDITEERLFNYFLPLLKLGSPLQTDSALGVIPENWYRGAHIESRQRKQELPTVDPQYRNMHKL